MGALRQLANGELAGIQHLAAYINHGGWVEGAMSAWSWHKGREAAACAQPGGPQQPLWGCVWCLQAASHGLSRVLNHLMGLNACCFLHFAVAIRSDQALQHRRRRDHPERSHPGLLSARLLQGHAAEAAAAGEPAAAQRGCSHCCTVFVHAEPAAAGELAYVRVRASLCSRARLQHQQMDPAARDAIHAPRHACWESVHKSLPRVLTCRRTPVLPAPVTAAGVPQARGAGGPVQLHGVEAL